MPVLPESAGYGIVLGFGIFFSIFTTTLVRRRRHPSPPFRDARVSKRSLARKLISKEVPFAFADTKGKSGGEIE